MLSIFSFLSQMYPPKPCFTEKDIPPLHGKVYIITGASSGIGLELAKILYSKYAKVYIAARSESKALSAISSIKNSFPDSTGALGFLPLDLADLSAINTSAQTFLSEENRLDILFNNAGIMNPPQGSKTAQGYELQLGTNCIGTFLFTKLLTPLLLTTAKTSSSSSVRVIWVSSSAAEGLSPKGGVDMRNLDYKSEKAGMTKYGVSKAGNYLHAMEFGRRFGGEGLLSVPLNPGNLDIVPWGRFMKIRGDLVAASKTKTEGGTGIARSFWEWNEEQVKPYL